MSTDLEKDFQEVAAKINAKLKEAAEAIQEANRLSETVGLPCLIYQSFLQEQLRFDGMSKEEASVRANELKEQLGHINVSALEAALGDGGWSTSSSYC